MLSDYLLSRMWHCGLMSVALIILRRMMYPICISVSVLFFNQETSVALVSTYTMTMMYLYPLWEWNGKYLVWSEYVLCFVSYSLKEISRALFPRIVILLVLWGGVALCLVEHNFFLDWFRYPFGISSVSG